MIKEIILSLIIVSVTFLVKAQVKFNGNLEQIDSTGRPTSWDYVLDHTHKYDIKLDSIVKKQGKYSVSISSGNNKSASGVIVFPIEKSLHGSTLTLIGNIKTENVTDGFAGLWLRVAGADKQILENDFMEKQGITGTNDWKEYMVEVPYQEDDAVKITAGAFLIGKGKIWIDSLRLYIDDTAIDKAATKPVHVYAATKDTSFLTGSGIDKIILNKQNTKYLTLLGQLWGFIKYHHPAIARGDYNWDAELFRITPLLLKCKSNEQVSSTLEHWIDELGKPVLCTTCMPFVKTKDVIVAPNYGSLFKNQIFSKALTNKLKYILANSNITSNYYVRIGDNVEKPTFRNEKEYKNMLYPDAGYRLLALYRYWNMIQYFFPSRHLISEDWNDVLPTFISKYVNAKNKTDYAVTTAKLISTIHDTHAFIVSAALEDFKGRYRLPFQAKFIEGKLVVTGYYKDTLSVKDKFKIGDIITTINGTSMKDLMRKYLPLTSASNYTTQLRDLPGAYLLRSNNPKFSFSIIRNNQFLKVDAAAAEISKISTYQKDINPNSRTPGYCLINNQIGYLVAGNYKNSDLSDIKKTFAGTKGIIVDMRCYPSDELEYTFGHYIKPFSSIFVRYTKGSVRNPGSFKFYSNNKNGEKTADNYKGKVVVIVNEITQSNAEFVTMAFQSGSNVKVIGSTTSGADGNISDIILPGGISTNISGIGIFYPDHTNTQRTGVKINYVVKPTIQDIKAGRDELLEKARKIILN